MKKLLIGLAILASMSSFASSEECVLAETNTKAQAIFSSEGVKLSPDNHVTSQVMNDLRILREAGVCN